MQFHSDGSYSFQWFNQRTADGHLRPFGGGAATGFQAISSGHGAGRSLVPIRLEKTPRIAAHAVRCGCLRRLGYALCLWIRLNASSPRNGDRNGIDDKCDGVAVIPHHPIYDQQACIIRNAPLSRPLCKEGPALGYGAEMGTKQIEGEAPPTTP